ncbi:MAG TPA: hypothetical protein V6D12_14180 [Candidatus Obscuribacterales bacterium]
MYNFDELKDNVAKLAQRSGDSDYESKIGIWLNLSLETLYNVYDWWLELRERYDFTSVDGQADYGMPPQFDKPLLFWDRTNDKLITIRTEEEYTKDNLANINDSTEGDVNFGYLIGVSGAKKQVSTSGSTVKAKSSTSETGSGITVRIEGYVDSDLSIVDYENIVVTGTSYVAGTKTFYKILHFSKSGDSEGYITLADASSNILANLGSKDRVGHHKIFRLGLIPDDSVTNYRILYKKKFRKMVNDYDYPFVEADEFLTLNSLGYALSEEKETSERAVLVWNKAKEALNLILTNQQMKHGPEYQHKMVSVFAQAHRR